MSYESLATVVDEPLNIDAAVLRRLSAFHQEPKFVNLPGLDTAEERKRLSLVLNDLMNRLIQRIKLHPTKLWVLTEFQRSRQPVEQEDT